MKGQIHVKMRRIPQMALPLFMMVMALVITACGGTAAPAGQATTAPAAAAATTAPAAAAATTAPAAAAATTAPAAADATAAPAAAPAEGGTTVTFWSRDSDQALIEPVIAAYNSSHPAQIKATFIPAAQFVQKFAAATAGGEAPDLIAVDLIYMPSFIAAGQMADITEQVKALPYFDKLNKAQMREGTADGKIYSLPFSADGSVLVYNKNLFKQAGLDPEKAPTTMDEMMQYSKKITALGNGTYGFYFSGNCPGCNAFTLMPYIWASGGDILSQDGKTATLTDPNVKMVLDWYRQMWADKQIPESAKVDTGTDFFNVFASGKIGMVGSGAFAIAALKNDHPDLDFGIVPLPGMKAGQQSSFAGGDVIGIPTGSKHVNEGLDFIKWYLSDEVQLEQVAKINGLPVREDLVDNKYSQKDPRYITVGNAMYKFGNTPFSVHYNEIWNDANGPWLAMIQKAVFDGDVDGAISEAQQQVTQILSQ